MWIKCIGDTYINIAQIGIITVSNSGPPSTPWVLRAEPFANAFVTIQEYAAEADAVAVADKLLQAFDPATL